MKRKIATLLLLIPILYAYLAFFSNALTDDAFITLQYVKTLLSSGTWGFIPGEIVNAVTSPLNIFLIGFAGILFGPTIKAVLWLNAFILALTTLLLAQMSKQLFDTELFGYLAAAALILNPLLISSLGLESFLFIALYILCTYFYIHQRWQLLGAALGLLTLTRFDGILFFLVSMLLVPGPKTGMRLAATYLLIIAPWYLFSWIYFGSFLPDTLFIKIAQRSWDNWEFINGLGLYFSAYRTPIVLSFVFLPLLFLLLNRQIRELKAIQFVLLTGIAHFIGYSLLHVPPYYWYYVTEVAAVILIGTLSLGQLSNQYCSIKWNRAGSQAMAALLMLTQAAGAACFLWTSHFAVKEMPIHTNWGTHEQYREIGTWLQQHYRDNTILVDGEVGTLGYYCECRLSSFFSDRKWLRLHVQGQLSGTGIRATLYRVNFLFFDRDQVSMQPDYLLEQIPGGDSDAEVNLMQWDMSTQWTPHVLVQLRRYSP